MSYSRTLTAAAILSIVACPQPARAEGLVFNTGGAKALARGGAVGARPDEPLTLNHDPAGLAMLQKYQVEVSVEVPFYSACVDPYGYYGWGAGKTTRPSEFGDPAKIRRNKKGEPLAGQFASDPLDSVCNSAAVLPVPQAAISARLSDEIGVGLGFVGPSAIINLQFGGKDGTIAADRNGTAVPRPTPTRYQIVSQELEFAVNPAAGIGYRIIPQLRVGLMAQWGALAVTNTVVQSQDPGTSPHDDDLVRVHTSDYFVPALTPSVHVTPIDPIDLFVAFHWRDDFKGSGNAVLETNTYQAGAKNGPVPYENDPIELSNVVQPLPWSLDLGARVSDRLEKRAYGKQDGDKLDDPLASEQWDLEVGASFLFTERTSVTTVSIADTCDRSGGKRLDTGCQLLATSVRADDGTESQSSLAVPAAGLEDASIDRHLENQLALRLGGSYAILPAKLSVHAGGSYETRGVDPDYATIGIMPFRRIGTGLGVQLRFGFIDVMVSYAHSFQETLYVKAPAHQNREKATESDPHSGFDKRIGECQAEDGPACDDPVEEKIIPTNPDGTAAYRQNSILATTTDPGPIVNAGKYTSSFDVFALAVTARF